MSLKAGRVGVAPDQVDEFGMIKSEATSGYTKQEADAKFETQTAATEALALKQPITLSVPIEMLSGTKLTVESALQALNTDKVNNTAIIDLLLGNVPRVLFSKVYGRDEAVNIDALNKPNGYMMRVITSGALFEGTAPSNMGNAFIIIGMSSLVAGGLGLEYGVQLAIGFGANKIAIRTAAYSAQGSTWNEWKYITF